MPASLRAGEQAAAAPVDTAAEVKRERALQAAFFNKIPELLMQLGVTANLLSEVLEVPDLSRPLILFAQRDTWWTVARPFSGAGREAVLLSARQVELVAREAAHENLLFAILAHEFGHVFQYVQLFEKGNPGYASLSQDQATNRDVELHADYMAGHCLSRVEARLHADDAGFVQRFSDTFFTLGTYNFGNSDHHGTPAERFASTMAGYVASHSAGGAKSVNEIADAGVTFIRQMRPR